jgi:hypothetical protein
LADTLLGAVGFPNVAAHCSVSVEPYEVACLQVDQACIASVLARFDSYARAKECNDL